MANLAAIIPAAKAPLEVHEVDTYNPGPHELLIKNEVIAFNPVEFKIAKLGIFPFQFPAIIGSTFGGRVEAVGRQVTDFQVGERVVVSKKFGVVGNQYGAYQRYVLVGDVMVSKVPADIDSAIPASLMMNLTCVVGLFTGRVGLDKPSLDGSTPVKGLKVLVYGGSSSFGGLSL
ncbi:chaperonin 10-like protein [Penicillium riverlandense]|uniref:chaperonin 10-like protein n=1 Tax=Penicillium riverlandense TaxID=1903569 RepID=UPI002546AD6B|nr:chaperonin 10-like protein [Penicillium riverlandense]KAJ5815013.1 chaperonin 10-like protein [Penicillium riverlandense]